MGKNRRHRLEKGQDDELKMVFYSGFPRYSFVPRGYHEESGNRV